MVINNEFKKTLTRLEDHVYRTIIRGESMRDINVLFRIYFDFFPSIAFKNPIIIIINLNQNLHYHAIKKSSEHTAVVVNTTWHDIHSFYLVI